MRGEVKVSDVRSHRLRTLFGSLRPFKFLATARIKGGDGVHFGFAEEKRRQSQSTISSRAQLGIGGPFALVRVIARKSWVSECNQFDRLRCLAPCLLQPCVDGCRYRSVQRLPLDQ